MKKPDKNKNKKNTSLRLDATTLKALKMRALEEDTTVQAILENLVEAYLDNRVKIKGESK